MADAAADGILHRARLLENFLEHVVRKLSALDLFRREFDLANLRADRRRLDGGHLEIIAGERDDLEVIEVYDTARVGDNRADVAGEKVFVAAHAEEQGTAPARADNLVGMVRMNDGDAVGADDVLERAAYGFRERGPVVAGMLGVDLLVMVADEMGENFRVRLRHKLVSLGQQAFLQKLVVLDDAVVDEGDLAGLVEVRVGIGIGRRAVRRPAGMADADFAFGGLFGKDGGQIVDATGLLAELELLVINDAEAGGIVTAVFEPAQAFEDDVLGGLPANVADDATHGACVPCLKSRNDDSTTRSDPGSAAMANHNGVDFVSQFVFIPPTVSNLRRDWELSTEDATWPGWLFLICIHCTRQQIVN